ncbi:transmembrane protein, putative (macronuclear) [Tetrahymena thermophila SB210]|uniref:Transmembrane protein, putative n=1 Tax=Tetrahymena thermophila (strain SB210) TaxID=312017 RepID=W7XFS9_TETTS|nr:transmembrane protein, putative [Tetrahymena thermophila SB210]EWS75723.1 transmembrane protein, putative [Tetrahymena thermophila SB210]|eukprot:XP_012651746.1 transmembrane protein, putative [Tetrahymena thermophila SB210]
MKRQNSQHLLSFQIKNYCKCLQNNISFYQEKVDQINPDSCSQNLILCYLLLIGSQLYFLINLISSSSKKDRITLKIDHIIFSDSKFLLNYNIILQFYIISNQIKQKFYLIFRFLLIQNQGINSMQQNIRIPQQMLTYHFSQLFLEYFIHFNEESKRNLKNSFLDDSLCQTAFRATYIQSKSVCI